MRKRGLVGRADQRRAARFVFLLSVFSAAVIAMACGEAFVLWLGGTAFVEKSSPEKICIGDFSISTNGKWGVSRVTFNSKGSGIVHDAVLHDLRDQTAKRLHLRCSPRCVAVSPASDVVAIACWDGAIRVWEGSPSRLARLSASGERMRLLDRISDDPISLVVSPDGRLLAAVGERFSYVWRCPRGQLLQKLAHKDGTSRFVLFSSDSRHVLSSGAKGKVCLRDAYSGQIIKEIKVISPVVGAAVTSAARLAAFVDGSGKVRVCSLVTAKELWSQPSRAQLVAFSPDGRFLATDYYEVGAGGYWRINVYDASRGQRICQLTGHDTPFPGLVYAADGLLYSYDQRGRIRAWNIDHQREQWCFSMLEWASNDPFFEEAR